MRIVLFLFCVAFTLLSFEASAKSTQFLCENEKAVSEIAAQVIISQEAADKASEAYLTQKVCVFLPHAVDIVIVYYGATYGSGALRVQVVGIGQKMGDTPDFYALMKLEEGI